MLNLFAMNYKITSANLVGASHTQNKTRISVFRDILMRGGVLLSK